MIESGYQFGVVQVINLGPVTQYILQDRKILDFLMYTANVLSVESTDECLRTKSENNKQ